MKYALMLLNFIPALIGIMEKLETVFPQDKMGPTKLSILKDIVAEIYPDIMVVWGKIEKIVALLVSRFNEKKVFNKTPTPPAAT